ncbi:hypothetical protein [Asticcacaulis sp. YBE204]|uniref:hypothetical protein n=1 Tax=Asticcacaulis sp. YBE204 TaxID=1282363 RepID=UPI0003C3CA22|nr:hypothetical protein [Asticcacaulis sp. YBE204]ESQ79299.1 hypothetical protein AEYBE204_09830 [Asticcacaulis sp. YBE204]
MSLKEGPVAPKKRAPALPTTEGAIRRSGRRAKPVIEFPQPKWTEWKDPDSFTNAMTLHMKRHGDSGRHLCRAVSDAEATLDPHTIRKWCSGEAIPLTVQSFQILHRIERRYGLPNYYFKARVPRQNLAARGHVLEDISPSEQRRYAWHLPDDFIFRPIEEQEEILAWVKRNIIMGSTEYRRYQAAAARHRFGLRFRGIRSGRKIPDSAPEDETQSDRDEEALVGSVKAPARLEAEMSELLQFKTSTLTAFGLQRNGVWGRETAAQKVEHLGLMFGALVASKSGPVRGYGATMKSLTFALLLFPAVWDWYLQWRETRRGFYTAWEVDMLVVGLSLVREETGWLRQNPELGDHLCVLPGLVSQKDILAARRDWNAACDMMYRHGRNRIKEIQRVARVHRDPFEPILPILEAESPVAEYRKITEEILRLMPDEQRYPKSAAEAVRAYLMLRLGLHLGLRQKNLRELMVCPRHQMPRSERQLEDMKRGEIRWSARENGWEVMIPAIAFKNATSSFFGAKPFRLMLPDLGGLYGWIDAYIDRHRATLIGPSVDPGTFFVKTAKKSSAEAAYNQTTFYEAWRLTIQRYGIYNPYTRRGAIKGLLPHGPHNVRDVLATHILKQTGSYEQASYAIQDTPDMVAQHYGRFLPQDKSALAAQILNRVWEAA